MMKGLVIGLVAVAGSLAIAASATAEGVTPAQLTEAGWTCFGDPAAPRIVCSDPAHGRPHIPADPDGPSSYNFKIFGLDGAFRGTIHLIRADLYEGQPCPQMGGSYVFIPPIGYYKCEHL
jgi:hypothetical protein